MSSRCNYFVCYDSKSGYSYNIYYAPMGFLPPSNWLKISPQEAISRIRLERRLRRRNNSNNGPIFILPHDFDHATEDIYSNAFYIQDRKVCRKSNIPYWLRDGTTPP